MIEKFKEFLEELKDNEKFKQFKEKNALAYNTSFCIINDQLFAYFYDTNSDRITSFTKQNDEIVSQEDEVFRKEKKEIKELQLDKVKIDLSRIEELMKQKLNQTPAKKIIILQQEENPYWNLTYLTKNAEIINIKIDAITEEIIDETIESALNLQKK